jgi:D-alanine--poly(phosphoribitol) ligase subunit 1
MLGRTGLSQMISWFVERLFETANATPNQIAVSHGGKTTSYSVLSKLVHVLGLAFAQISQTPKVVICAEASAETYAAMFATLAAGGFYVPLNAQVGETRLATAVERIVPDVIATTRKVAGSLAGMVTNASFIYLDEIDISSAVEMKLRNANHLAYVMFTSGSTGVPKGVMISQNALQHHVSWATLAYHVTPQDRWSQHHNIGFDLSVLDIFCTLVNGATLCPLTSQMDRLFPARAIRREAITIWHSVPSTMGMILRSGDWNSQAVQSLRLLSFCGEPLLPEHLDGVFDVLPSAKVFNTYGPTEATILCTKLELDAANYRNWCKASVALGDPIDGMSLVIERDKTEKANIGELFIAGPQLAEGYWQDEEKSAAVFRNINLDGELVRAYATGDFVERGPDGLYFLERRDNQVKIKGHRIELNEISSHLRRLGYINAETFVFDEVLVSVVEAEAGDANAMRKSLSGKLEAYMLPKQILFHRHFPRNSNEKTDIKALREWCDAQLKNKNWRS